MEKTFQGYKRVNGRVGVRNHVIILPVDDLSNAASTAVANNIQGTMALPHPYGRLQFGADLELHFRTLIGTGSNPNVARKIAEPIARSPGYRSCQMPLNKRCRSSARIAGGTRRRSNPCRFGSGGRIDRDGDRVTWRAEFVATSGA